MKRLVKKIFKKKNRAQEHSKISADDWVEEFERYQEIRIKDTLFDLSESINKEAERLREKAQSFLELSVKDPKIPPRIESIIDANKQKYVRKLRVLAIDGILDKSVSSAKTREAHQHFVHALEEFHETTSRTFYKLKDYFYTELREIIRMIKNMERFYIEIGEVVELESHDKFERLKGELKEYRTDKINENRLKEGVTWAKRDIEDSKNKLIELNKRKESMKLTKDFEEHKNLYERKERVMQRISKKKIEMQNIIFALESPLKEFKRNDARERLIERYLFDPVSAALSDVAYTFNKVAFSLNKELKDGKIGINLKNKRKITSALEKLLQSNYIKSWSYDYTILSNTKKEIEIFLAKNKIMLDISELDYKIDHENEKMRKSKNIISNSEEKIEQINSEKRKAELEEEFNNFAKKEVVII